MVTPASTPPAPRAFVPRGLAHRGMPRRLGPLFSWFARAVLDGIVFPAAEKSRILALQASGAVIVWVHRTRNPVEHLALARVVDREALPRASYVGGLNVVGLQPPWALGTWLRGGMGKVAHEERLLRTCVDAGLCAEIFLRRPLTLISSSSGYRARFMNVLVQAQRDLLSAADNADAPRRRIVLVPVFLAMAQRPGNFEPTPLDAVFGTVQEPGLLRALSRVVAAGEHARFEVSEPVDLSEVVAEHNTLSVDHVAKKVRWVILHHLARVERLCHGPQKKDPARARDDLKKDPKLLAFADTLSTQNGIAKATTAKRIDNMHAEIAALPDIDTARVFSWLLDVLWKRIYEGIFVDEPGIARLREAAKRGPLILVPSHRSHVDYLVLSQVMLKRGLVPPLVAAGDNLSFFPLGALFRRGGAFFLRRSMKGDALYVAVFKAYVRRVFAEGYSLEFFIEGGRSRTGKTLPPKLGLLSMIVEAYVDSREHDAVFMPCHISYERVIEAGAYAGELQGKAKQAESAAGLVQAVGVLKRRYGRVYVTFDAPISLADHLASRALSKESLSDPASSAMLRAAVQSLGHRIVYGINRAGVVTAVSLVCASVMGFRKKGLDEALLVLGASQLLKQITTKTPTARLQPGMADALDDNLQFAINQLTADGVLERQRAGDRVLYRIADGCALEVDAQKNQLLHHVVPECILAAALAACGGAHGAAVPIAALSESAHALSRLLKLEVIFQVGASFSELFLAALQTSNDTGLLRTHDGTVSVAQHDDARMRHRFGHNLILGFLETYATVFQSAPGLAKEPIDEKALVSRATATIVGRVAAGELHCDDAVSNVAVQNAIALLRELDVLRQHSEHRLIASSSHTATSDSANAPASQQQSSYSAEARLLLDCASRALTSP